MINWLFFFKRFRINGVIKRVKYLFSVRLDMIVRERIFLGFFFYYFVLEGRFVGRYFCWKIFFLRVIIWKRFLRFSLLVRFFVFFVVSMEGICIFF